MYFGDEIDGFLGLATEVSNWADSAPFGLQAEAAELSLIDDGGEGVGDVGDGATEEVASVCSPFRGRILP